MRMRELEQRQAYSMGYVSGQLDLVGGMLMGKCNEKDNPFAPLADDGTSWLYSVWCLTHNLTQAAWAEKVASRIRRRVAFLHRTSRDAGTETA